MARTRFWNTQTHTDRVNSICTSTIHGGGIIKKHQRGDKYYRQLSFLYTTHRHDLIYITAKYHQNIPNAFEVIERTRKRLLMGHTDGWQAHRYIPANLPVGG